MRRELPGAVVEQSSHTSGGFTEVKIIVFLSSSLIILYYIEAVRECQRERSSTLLPLFWGSANPNSRKQGALILKFSGYWELVSPYRSLIYLYYAGPCIRAFGV